MSKIILEIEKTGRENVEPNGNVIFNVIKSHSDKISYNTASGEITFLEAGQYSIRWWVATETALSGCIQFSLKSSQGDDLIGCSPTKRGQVLGFGGIDIPNANITVSLVNVGMYSVVMSKTSPVTAALLIMRIPEDSVVPSFDIDNVETLEPDEEAVVDIQQDIDNPNNWLFSLGIPKGMVGPTGKTGPTGPAGPITTTIPFSIGKYGVSFSTDARGEPLLVSFSGFAPAYNSDSYLQEGEWATGTITIREEMYYATAFIMPNNGILQKIHALFSTAEAHSLPEGIVIRPFVCLAVSKSDSLVYTILQESMTFTEEYIGGVDYPKHTLRRGFSENLNIQIEEGTLVTIIAGIMGSNVTTEQYLRFSVSGGIYME